MPPPESDAPVTLGRILRPHGVRGAVVVAADSSVHSAFRAGLICRLQGPSKTGAKLPRTLTVTTVTDHGGALRLRFEGIEQREEAAELAGATLCVRAADMPGTGEDEYYDFQIIGLEAVDPDGVTLGTVAEIIPTGATDVYVIKTENGELLVPANGASVLEIDIDRGVIVIDAETAVSNP